VLSFERAVLNARREIGPGPPVTEEREGATIPYLGTERIFTLDLGGGEQTDFHLLQRTLGLWAVTAAFDDRGHLVAVLQLKQAAGEVTVQLSPGGAGKMEGRPTTSDIINRAEEVFSQETGYGEGDWCYLGDAYIDDNKMLGPDGGPLRAHLLMATRVRQISEPQPRSTDFYRVVTIPPEEFGPLLRSPYLKEVSAKLCLQTAFMELGILQLVPSSTISFLAGRGSSPYTER
jgi:hypothetical protein